MKTVKFKEPIPGTMICLTDEKIAKGLDHIDCIVDAPVNCRVSVNGVPCQFSDGYYRASVPFAGKKTTLLATNETYGETDESHVFRLYTPKKVYRVSVDDNIWFLQDLARNQNVYQSIFDNAYLALYKKLHEEYGTKFHFNIYYTCPEHGGFSLPELSDKFKAEWQSVLPWLTLSFHAKANLPDWPYAHSNYKTVYKHCHEVNEEIKRFAGYITPVTTLHFAEAPKECIRALYDCGIRALLGDYSLNKNGEKQICYFATQEEFDTVRRYSFWKDPATEMIMFPCDTVLNSYPPEGIVQEMNWFSDTYGDRSFVDILIHEEYFYTDYYSYLPDYEQRLRAGIEYCRQHGFVPGFVRDIIDFSDTEIFGADAVDSIAYN